MSRQNNYIKEVNKFIGNKLYYLRIAKGMSRKELSKIIDVTHQQLYKYEHGTNQIAVGRLSLISKALGEDISYFYDGMETTGQEKIITQHQRMGIEVSRNFMKIKNAEYQTAINTLIRSLSRN